MQKPIFALYLVILASLGLGLFASQKAVSSMLEYNIPEENPYLGRIVVTCPPGLITYVDENCEVELLVEIPFSNCNITSMTYSVDGGPAITVPQGTIGPILIGTFSPDTFNIMWNVMDDCIPPITAECTQPIFIMDSIPPTIICPDNITVTNSDDGRRNVLLSIAQPVVSDNCGILFYINDYNNTDDASDIYPVGITPIIWTVTDIYGNTASCTMSVEVIDVLPPTIICPDTLFTTCTASSPYQYYLEFIAAGGSATDDTEIDTSTFTWVEDIDTSLSCPDTIVRFYRIGDTNGNFDTCSQILIVYDTIAPTAICKDVTVNLDVNGEVTISVDSLDNGSFDNCMGDIVLTTNFPLFFGCNDVISSQIDVILRVTDQCGNSATCISTVTVFDLINPTITCPPIVSVDTDEGQCYASGVVLGNPITSDNCNVAITVATFMGNIVTLNTQFPVGTNNVIWTVTDIGGNTATCSQSVIVEDNQSPEITCPANITVNTTAGLCSAIVNYQVPVGTDNCPSPMTTQTTGIASGGVFSIGPTNNTFVVTDQSGATASCSFTVTVVDNQPPIISCPQNITVNTTPGLCSATVNYTAPIGTDNCPGATTTQTTGLASGVNYSVGVTVNTFVVTASNGQTSSCSFTVTVIDNQPPTISCPPNLTVNTNINLCSAVVNYVTPVGTDNCPGATTTQTSGLPNGSIFPLGTTTNTFVVTASNGQTASCSFTVTVVDIQLPSISCPTNITVNARLGLCNALVNYTTPIGTDNCPSATTTQTSGLPSGSIFPVGVTVNTFVVTANNGQSASCSFMITVIDNQPPNISCPPNLTVDTDLNLCSAVVNYVTPVGTDNCLGATSTQTSGLPSGSIFPVGTTTNTFVVTASNGQSASCSFTVTVVDNQLPSISCPSNITVNALPGLCSATVNYTAPIGTDNCPGATTTRTTGLSSGVTYSGGVTINTFEVTASNGQTASCSFTVTVLDNQPPTITIDTLPDISVSCAYLLNLNNLSAFGTFVQQGTTRQNIVINDPGNPFYPTGIAGQDGIYTDNCPGSLVTVTSRNLITMCNTGEIKRDFVITDIGGNTATYTQTIYIIDVDKFDVNDITWPPATVNYNNCNDSDPDVSITGEPILKTDKCNQVAATYRDQVFTNPNNCGFIKRTWTVIDWCQYETNNPGGPGKWTFVQSILITNTVAPVIDARVCRDTIICTGNGCDATVTFNGTGTDDCLPVSITWSYKIDLDNNGSVDVSGVGSTITRKYNFGQHKITWQARDRCGNISSCSSLFTIRDCKSPSVIALHGLAINLLPPTGRATIKAKYFNKSSSDNCTQAPLLKYSFSSNVNDTIRHFTCDSLGQRRIELWATDLAGNQSSAITYILVQDNTDICGLGNKVNIKGHVFTEENVKVADTKVSIDGGETDDYLMTNVEGEYVFSDLAKYNNYELLPVKDIDHGQGITTLDLVLIQRHILGIKYIESPYKLIAADVNNSQSITAADLVELRKLILGVQSKFSKNTSWRFVDASYVFNDKTHPWPFVEKLNYEELSTSMEHSDFIGVKIGDVNGTVSQNILGQPVLRSQDKLNLFIENIDAAAHELITIPVKIDHLDNYIGMQWTLELSSDMEYIGFESVDLPLKNDHLALIDKKGKKYLTLSYDDMNGISLPNGSVLFNIIGRPLKNTTTSQLVWINDAPLKAEAYTIEDITAEVELTYRSLVTEGVSFIMQNHPNPFKDETVFHFSLQEKSPVVFSVYDASGALVFKSNEVYNEGNHSITLTANQLGNKYGIFLCKIKTKNLDQVIKILRIE